MGIDLIVERDHAAASERAALLIVDAVRAGRSLGLSGGSTPSLTYRRAAALEPDWRDVSLWLGDDRYVPRDDERSNVRLLQETWSSTTSRAYHVCSCARRAWPWRRPPPASTLLLRAEGLPHLQLLGLGPDGHTASLFPHAPSLDERERLAVAAPAGMEPFVDRVTMTIPALAGAEHVIFLVTGVDKAEMAKGRLRGGAVEGDPGEPRALLVGNDDGDPRRGGGKPLVTISHLRAGDARAKLSE